MGCFGPQHQRSVMDATKSVRNLPNLSFTASSIRFPSASNALLAPETMSRLPDHNCAPSVRSTDNQASCARIVPNPPGEAPMMATGLAAKTRGMSAGGREAQSRSEEHTSELQSLMRLSYAVFCLKKKIQN